MPPEAANAPPTYDGPKLASAETFGLRHNALSPLETLAQSVSTIAPSTTPQLTHTNPTHETPGEASILSAYGFLTAYGLVAVALAVHLHHSHRLTASPPATSYQPPPPRWRCY